MPASKRLKDCILDYQKLLAEMRTKALEAENAQDAFRQARAAVVRKNEELLTEIRTCFPDSARTKLIQIENKFYLLHKGSTELEGFVQEVFLER